MPNKINTFVIPVLNNYEGLYNLLVSLERYTEPNYNVIVIDNGLHTDFSPKLAHEFSKVDLWIKPARNLGFGKAMNQGIKLATTEYITLANDDVEVIYKGWWDEIIQLFKEDSRLAGFNPHSFINKSAAGDRVCQYEIKDEYTDEDIKKMKEVFHAEKEYSGCCTFFTICKKELFDKIGLFDESFGLGSGEDYDLCYDKETQIMTKHGIKYLKDISFNDKILTMDKNDNMIYEKPTHIIKKFEKKLLHFKSKRIDIKCSPDQNLLIGYEYKGKGIYKDIDYIRANEINNKLWDRQCRYFVKKNGGKWKGKSLKTKKSFVRFMGWYLSEGSVDVRMGHNEIIISQSLKNEKNRNEIEKTIKNLGYKCWSDKNGIRFSNKKFANYLKSFGKCQNKFIPQEIKDLSIEHLEIFLDAYIKGDGNYRDDGFNIVTSSDKMKDDLIELILKTERTFNLSKNNGGPVKIKGKIYDCKPCWQIQVREKRKEKAYLRKAKEVDYNDFVYDITIPSHKIYIIRNGKGCWSSNCLRAYRAGYKIKGGSRVMVKHWWGATKDNMPEGEGMTNYDLIAGGNASMERKWGKHKDKVEGGWSVSGVGGALIPLDSNTINADGTMDFSNSPYKEYGKWYQEVQL